MKIVKEIVLFIDSLRLMWSKNRDYVYAVISIVLFLFLLGMGIYAAPFMVLTMLFAVIGLGTIAYIALEWDRIVNWAEGDKHAHEHICKNCNQPFIHNQKDCKVSYRWCDKCQDEVPF